MNMLIDVGSIAGACWALCGCFNRVLFYDDLNVILLGLLCVLVGWGGMELL